MENLCLNLMYKTSLSTKFQWFIRVIFFLKSIFLSKGSWDILGVKFSISGIDYSKYLGNDEDLVINHNLYYMCSYNQLVCHDSYDHSVYALSSIHQYDKIQIRQLHCNSHLNYHKFLSHLCIEIHHTCF